MDDVTTDAQATVTELQQQAADDYAHARDAHEWQTRRDDANVCGSDRSAA
ncbi:hypothetical protein PUR59_04250 [Streptomyces sp. SP18ES09]|nr:hypothetical protein [Streptomyces sp. SP18ES09]MEE1814232.1 hypothetical protein [Streptomyces sp. SP18ES09]